MGEAAFGSEYPSLHIRSLVCLVLLHTAVDTYAQLLAPLWPRFGKDLGLAPWLATALFAVWQMATSVSQPLFGYWGDRFGSRWMVAIGPALGVVCISLIGFANGAASLALLLLIGGLGIGAFHPEAAAGVAEASGPRAAQGLALFTCAGMLGLGLGPLISGTLVEQYGLPGLTWALLPGLLFVGAVALVRSPGIPATSPGIAGTSPGIAIPGLRANLVEILDGRSVSVVLLLAVATLRVVPALGVPLGLAFLLDQRGVPADAIGRAQSLFLLSGGIGTLLCPFFTRPGREQMVLVATIVPAAGFLALLAGDETWWFYVGLAASGLLLQGGIPVLIAYSQRLLPRGRRLAASLTLGASWGAGGLIVAALQAYFKATGHLEGMLWAMVPFAVVAGLGSCLLPRLPVPGSHHAVLPSTRPDVTAEPVPAASP
jgi:FSR family fosmidomycin resistance protein-like MFS transporter